MNTYITSPINKKSSILVPITEVGPSIKYLDAATNKQVITPPQDLAVIQRSHAICQINPQNLVTAFNVNSYMDYYIDPSSCGQIEEDPILRITLTNTSTTASITVPNIYLAFQYIQVINLFFYYLFIYLPVCQCNSFL